MSERNLGLEIDELKKDLQEIKELLKVGKQKSKDNKKEDALNTVLTMLEGNSEDKEGGEAAPNYQIYTFIDDEDEDGNIFISHKVYTNDNFDDNDPCLRPIRDRMEEICESGENSGCITYVGAFESANRRSIWVRNEVGVDKLLNLIETGMAVKVLNCIGNNDRLNILLAILKKPMTVAELVKNGGYSSTGQVYHHLKPLIAADLIGELDDLYPKGTYAVHAHKVKGIVMLLAGICDMLVVDDKYEGNWGE